jgi:chromosome partitioning protein
VSSPASSEIADAAAQQADVTGRGVASGPNGQRPIDERPIARPAAADIGRAALAQPVASLSGVTVLAVTNQKGGVGKTTTAVNVAACIAETGYSTLLVDVDPQANATVGVGMAKDLGPSLYDVLSGACDISDAVHPTRINGLRLIPAGDGLAGAQVELPRMAGSETRLREVLAPLRTRFDFALLDCPPSLGPLTVNALVAADRVIVPVQTEYYALEGLAQLLDTVGLIQRELNPRLTVAGVLLTMHDDRTRLAQDVEREVRQHFPELVFETVIPRNVRVGEAPSYGLPVTVHDPHCAGADAYVALAREVAARV